MSSNRVVKYIDLHLNSIEEYWGELVWPSIREFRSAPSPRSVFQSAHAVWHLHDWDLARPQSWYRHKASVEYDYKGRMLPSLEHAQQRAELIALDLACISPDLSGKAEVQIRGAE